MIAVPGDIAYRKNSFEGYMYFIPDRAKINPRNFPSVSSGTAFIVLEIQASTCGIVYVIQPRWEFVRRKASGKTSA